MTTARERYSRLESDRHQFLDSAIDCAQLTLPYLIREDNEKGMNHRRLVTPWQSVGAKGVNVMASRLMLSLFPVNAKFFKLQISGGALAQDPDIDAQARSEIDLVLSKMERVVMQDVAEKADRVALHQAMKHLVVSGNVLVFLSPLKYIAELLSP